jgi:5-methyltetrahydropteroyltriglutamate--homocysteine methyltransferase
MDVVTDGEMRRLSFQSQLIEAVEGFADWDLDAFLWGTWRSDELEDVKIERPPIALVDTLRRKRFLSAEEFTYTRGRTDRIVKVTLPSPSLFANFWDPDRSADAYDSLESFLGDVAEILREEVVELVRLGATYIQLDAPHYPLLIDPGIGTSTRAGVGRPIGGSSSARSSITSSSPTTSAWCSASICAGGTS